MLARSAVQFEELTPRPSYEKLSSKKGPFPTTTKIFERIVATFQINEQVFGQILSKKNPVRTFKVDQVRQDVLNDVAHLIEGLDSFENENPSPE